MDTILRNAIKKRIYGKYPEKSIDESVDALSDLLFLFSMKDELKEKELQTLLLGNTEDKETIVRRWGHIETVLKQLCLILYPEIDAHEIKLEALYKDVFNLVPHTKLDGRRDFVLTSANRQECERNYPQYSFIGEFVALYNIRNQLSHGEGISSGIVEQTITDLCMILLYLSMRFRKELRTQALLLTFVHELPAEWLSECDADYKKMQKEFGYIDFKWETNSECTTAQIAYLNSEVLKNEPYIKLLGQAGSGKTTALIRIKHLLLDKYDKLGLVPVYFELKNLSIMKDVFLPYIIMNVFGVSEEAAKALLESQRLVLLFDGYNEILNRDIRRQFAIEVTRFLKDHQHVRIVMTDRNEQNEILILPNNSKHLTLKKITDQEREDYFRKNCADAQTLNIIINALKSDPSKFEMLNTPLKLHNLIELTVEEGAVPNDFTAEYLKKLFQREKREKMDPNLDVLEDYLIVITALTGLENKPIEKREILSVMARVDAKIGYKHYNSLEALRLARDMGLLHEETVLPEGYRREITVYQFEDTDYLVYYNDLLFENEILADCI